MEQVTGLQVLRQAVTTQAKRVTASAVLSAMHQAGEALVPVLIGVVIDRAVAGGSVPDLVGWLSALALTFVGLSFSFRFGARAGEWAAERAAHSLRLAVTRRVLHPRGGAEVGRLPGALANVATSDAERVGMVDLALALGFSAVVGVLVGAIALLRVSLPLGLLVLIGAPLLLWSAHLLGRPLQRRSDVEQDRAAHAAGIAADLVAGLRVLKGIGAESAAAVRYRAHQPRLAHRHAPRRPRQELARRHAARAHRRVPGGRRAGRRTARRVRRYQHRWPGGRGRPRPVPARTAVAVRLGQRRTHRSRASAARVAAVLSATPAVGSGGRTLPAAIRGHVTVRELSHGRLRGLSFEVAPGELVGIVTADPAEATALVECLGRQAEPATGQVELDGQPLAEVDPEAARGAVLVDPHDAALFAGTLLDNVSPDRTGDAEPRFALVMAASAADEVAADTGRRGERHHHRGRPLAVRRAAPAGRPGPGARRRRSGARPARADHRGRPGHRVADRHWPA